MKLITKIISIILFVIAHGSCAYAGDKFSWMNSSIASIGSSVPACIEAPEFSGISQTSQNLNLDTDQDTWVATGVRVSQGKMLSMQWDTSAIVPRPRKYLVLYRIDPRFANPQIFIQTYDYAQKRYISDFQTFSNGALVNFQNTNVMSQPKIDFLNAYFNFVGRNRIQVNKNDVVNITLDSKGSFFGANTGMQNGLGNNDNLLTIFTDTNGLTNKILYASALRWCTDIITSSDPDFATKCLNNSSIYINPTDQWASLTGRPSEVSFNSKITSIPPCPNNVNGPDNVPACFYDKGRGFAISVAGSIIKPINEQFVYSKFTQQYFIYHHSDSAGNLDFTTSWPISSIYPNITQTMDQWSSYAEDLNLGYMNFTNYLNEDPINAQMSFLHFGVYAMVVEIGSGSGVVAPVDLNSMSLNYAIADSINNISQTEALPQNFRNDANASGFLFLKVSGAGAVSGGVNVKIANYNGSNWFSTLVYHDIVTPLRQKYNELSQLIYIKLVTDPALQNIGRACMILYVLIYGLFFLAGSIQITATDLLTRIVKIIIVTTLFSPTSWSFFNNNLFSFFVEGSDYLFSSVIGVTSSVGNIFGFIDPILDKYTNPNIWELLGIQLLQIHNGLIFFAILTIYSILIYFRAILEVIISYSIAFLGLAVMISLAPFFIILMLFEKTKSMFDNWLSMLFDYMVSPTILLIFFLLIDQMMTEYITGTVVRACWGILIPIKLGLDLSALDIPLKFSFAIPGFPGIPFYIPVVEGISSTADLFGTGATFIRIATSSFIFFVYCKLAAGLIEYVNLVVSSLTNVLPARQDGMVRGSQNTVGSIMGDMQKLASPVTGTISGIGKFAKEKFIDQKISHRKGATPHNKDIDYGKIKASDEQDGNSNVGSSSGSGVAKVSDIGQKNMLADAKTGGVSGKNQSDLKMGQGDMKQQLAADKAKILGQRVSPQSATPQKHAPNIGADAKKSDARDAGEDKIVLPQSDARAPEVDAKKSVSKSDAGGKIVMPRAAGGSKADAKKSDKVTPESSSDPQKKGDAKVNRRSDEILKKKSDDKKEE